MCVQKTSPGGASEWACGLLQYSHRLIRSTQSNPKTKARRFLGKKTPCFCGTDHQEETPCIWNTNTIAVIPMTIRTMAEHAHDHSHTAAPLVVRLIALMRYMVGLNVSHTNELKGWHTSSPHTGGDSEACARKYSTQSGLRNRQSEARSKSGSASK